MKTGSDFLSALRRAEGFREELEWAEGYLADHPDATAYEIQAAIPRADWAYCVARGVAGADKYALERAVEESGDEYWTERFRRDV